MIGCLLNECEHFEHPLGYVMLLVIEFDAVSLDLVGIGDGCLRVNII